jgi:hypothetical protein
MRLRLLHYPEIYGFTVDLHVVAASSSKARITASNSCLEVRRTYAFNRNLQNMWTKKPYPCGASGRHWPLRCVQEPIAAG